jgi:tetratricopeptide (TPR) repeat protein
MRSKYAAILSNIENTYSEVICEYCGTETPSIGDACICSNCECLAHITRQILASRDNPLLASLDNIRSKVASSEYADAISVYDKLILERQDPFLMYAEALLYIQYSNYELSKISYDKTGFMDENASSRAIASKFISNSKRLLQKAISAVELDISKGNKSANATYLLFLCQLKMQNYRAARSRLEELGAMPDKYIFNYASMIFNILVNDHKSAEKFADKLLSNDIFSINSLYYIAFIRFKQRNFTEAKELLTSLNQLIPNRNVGFLLDEIKE